MRNIKKDKRKWYRILIQVLYGGNEENPKLENVTMYTHRRTFQKQNPDPL